MTILILPMRILILTKLIITLVQFVVKQPAGAPLNNTADMNTDNH